MISSIRKRINNQILKLKFLSLSCDYSFEFREAMDVFIWECFMSSSIGLCYGLSPYQKES